MNTVSDVRSAAQIVHDLLDMLARYGPIAICKVEVVSDLVEAGAAP